MAFNAFMHERNIYRNQPNFAKLASEFPEFLKYTIPDAKGGKVRVDFSNTAALRMLTKILLKKDFNLNIEIPEGFLIPTVPQRLNYVLWLEDLLSNISQNESEKMNICGIDIGTGACAIFSVLGAQKNGWKFTATESSDDAIMWAKSNIQKNNLHENIKVVKVKQGGSSLDEVLSSNTDCFHFCMCNPPFFENSDEIRKKHPNSDETIADVAQKDEIFVSGGELDFVRNILKDSLVYKNRIRIFTSMFGKKKSFLQILKDLKEVPDSKFTSTEFCQGNTIRWGVAWTFDQSIQFQQEVKKRSKPKKTKPPLEYEIFVDNSKKFHLDTIVKQAKVYLKSLEIHFTIVRSSQNFTELLLKSDKNTWTHQRRKRRELKRQGKEDETLITVPVNEKISSVKKEHDKESLKSNFSIEKNISLKDNDVVMEDSKIDIQATFSGNKEVNVPDKEFSMSSVLEAQSGTSESQTKCVKDAVSFQNNKRKLDLDSEDSTIGKKVKVEDIPNTEIIPDKQNILFEGSVEKSSMLNPKEETNSNTDVDNNSLSIHEPHSLSSLNNTGAVSSIKIETNFSEIENESKDNKMNETTEDTEPEGSVLYCYLQFLKGKNKVYVKMNCRPEADRNTMYQVFQLVKNKIN